MIWCSGTIPINVLLAHPITYMWKILAAISDWLQEADPRRTIWEDASQHRMCSQVGMYSLCARICHWLKACPL